MKTEIQEVGPCKKRIDVEVGVDEVKDEFNTIFTEVAKSAALPGFRVGRVPRALLEKRFGDTVGDEVKQKLVAKAFDDLMKEHEFSILGEPKMDKVEFEKEKPLTFQATFEVKPGFELPDYFGIELVEESGAITEKDIDEVLHGMRLRASDIEVVEDGKLKKDDLAIMHAELFVDGTSEWKNENLEAYVGGEAIAGMKVGSVEKLLKGKKAGDAVDAKVTFPKDFTINDKVVEKGTLKLKILDIKRPKMPPLDGDFAKKLGMESVEMLREEVRKGVERDTQQRLRQQLEDDLVTKLIDSVDMQLPLDMMKLESQRLYHQKRQVMARSGMPKGAVEERDKEVREDSDREAKRSLKKYFVLEKIAEKENITVSDTDFEARVNLLSQMHRVPPKQMMKRIETDGSASSIRSEMRDRKALELLYQKADIKKVAPKPEPAKQREKAAPGKGAEKKKSEKKKTVKKKVEKKKTEKKTEKKKTTAKKPSARKTTKKASVRKKKK